MLYSGDVGNLSAQFVPQIAVDSSVQVINFCRSPQWYVPQVSSEFGLSSRRRAWLTGFYLRCFFQIQFDYPGWAKWVFAHVPFAMRAYRAFLMIKVGHGMHLRGPCSCAY